MGKNVTPEVAHWGKFGSTGLPEAPKAQGGGTQLDAGGVKERLDAAGEKSYPVMFRVRGRHRSQTGQPSSCAIVKKKGVNPRVGLDPRTKRKSEVTKNPVPCFQKRMIFTFWKLCCHSNALSRV